MEERAQKPDRRRELGAQSREAILDAALALMSESGYEGATVAKIAKASGLPASSIYWHFGSKAGVLAAVMERGADTFFTLTRDSQLPPEKPEAEPFEKLMLRLHLARKAFEANPEFLRLLFLLILAEPRNEAVAAIVARINAQGREILHHQIFESYRAAGESVAQQIADRLTVPALAMFNGAVVTIHTNPEVSLESLIDSMARTVYLLAED